MPVGFKTMPNKELGGRNELGYFYDNKILKKKIGVPPSGPTNSFLCLQLILNFYFTIQFYYKKEDVCKKPGPNIFKIGRVICIFRNWPISDQFFKISKSRPIFEIWIQFFFIQS